MEFFVFFFLKLFLLEPRERGAEGFLLWKMEKEERRGRDN